jgi:hypothetical protein
MDSFLLLVCHFDYWVQFCDYFFFTFECWVIHMNLQFWNHLFKKSLRGGFSFHIAHVDANIVIKQIDPVLIPL